MTKQPKYGEMMDLRILAQEKVHEFTHLKREAIKRERPDITPDELDKIQPLVTEYDPVVELAIMGSDRSLDASIRRSANSDVAQYTRPKLKAIEMIGDLGSDADSNKNAELSSKLVDLLGIVAAAKSKSS